ncbi:hypothetical protein [Streptomyces sp. NPDC060322]|uniref:hypothetical protein n=1 Tax=Streptomyces sp. NPDC060322 TaxID=3347097 RepID=UPI003647407F
MNWGGGIASVDVWYRDESGARHYMSTAPEDLGLGAEETAVRVVYDPLRASRATTEAALGRPIWRTTEGLFLAIGLAVAAGVTALVVLVPA